MDDQVFLQHLDLLEERMTRLPEPERSDLQTFVVHLRHDHVQRQHLVAEAVDALDQLRLNLKYLIFDLEATKRENAEYRQVISELQMDGE